MQRIALLMILAAVPLLCASMLAQSSDVSVDGTMRSSLASSNYESAKQCFHGQWFSTSGIAPESSCTMNGFPTVTQPTSGGTKQRSTAGRPNAIHSLIAIAHLQPVYENRTNPTLVERVRLDVAKLYFLRPAGQPLNPPDHQKVNSQSEFAREWKQNAKAAEIQSVAQIESAERFRPEFAARAHSTMRRPTNYQRDGDSENNCFSSEEEARPARQYQLTVAGDIVRSGVKDPIPTEKLNALEVETFRSIESLPIWSEASGAVARGMKIKNGVAVK